MRVFLFEPKQSFCFAALVGSAGPPQPIGKVSMFNGVCHSQPNPWELWGLPSHPYLAASGCQCGSIF